MQRTISISLDSLQDQEKKLLSLQDAFRSACNLIVPSGKDARCMKHMNHTVSKAIVQEAVKMNAGVIALEDLKNIRKRIKGGLRMRTRLHRWSFQELQAMIQYKAEAKGIKVLFVHPAYSSQECSECGQLGIRQRHTFKCLCGHQQHADLNASRNHCRFAQSLGRATCAVIRT